MKKKIYKCECCGHKGEIGKDLFRHTSKKKKKDLILCHECHVSEHQDENNGGLILKS
jgi:hypothetical protein